MKPGNAGGGKGPQSRQTQDVVKDMEIGQPDFRRVFRNYRWGAELAEPGQALGRLTGIALLGFALACWPKQATNSTLATFVYNLLATLYLSYLARYPRERQRVCCCGQQLLSTCF